MRMARNTAAKPLQTHKKCIRIVNVLCQQEIRTFRSRNLDILRQQISNLFICIDPLGPALFTVAICTHVFRQFANAFQNRQKI